MKNQKNEKLQLIWGMAFWIVIIFNFINPSFVHLDAAELKFNMYKTHIKWLTKDYYYMLHYACTQYKIDERFAMAIIYAESNGRRVVGKKNSNGTRDYGRFQVNEIHHPDSPYELLDDELNIKKAFKYLNYCIKRSNGDIYKTIVYYNAGVNSNVSNYTNKKYLKKIVKKYQELIDETSRKS